MNWRVTLAFIVVCLGLLGVLYKGFGSNPREVPFMLKGQAAPPFTLRALDSGMRVSSEQLKGRPMVINFWASWCGPCREEHPQLIELAKDPAVKLVGINYKDNPENARRFLGQIGNPFAAVGIDPSGRAAIDWGVYGVPETFVVGPDGTIRHKHIGPLTAEALPGFREKLRAAAR